MKLCKCDYILCVVWASIHYDQMMHRRSCLTTMNKHCRCCFLLGLQRPIVYTILSLSVISYEFILCVLLLKHKIILVA